MTFRFFEILNALIERIARASPSHRALTVENETLKKDASLFESQRRLFTTAREALVPLSQKLSEISAALSVSREEASTAQARAKDLEAKVVSINHAYNQVSRDFVEMQQGKITLKQMAIRDGKLTAEFGTEMAALLANQFHEVLEKVGADNYVEMQFIDHTDPSKKVIVIIQRSYGKSPHQLRQDAEADVVQLRGQLDKLGT